MVAKKVAVEIFYCDICNEKIGEASFHRCIICKKDICSDCSKNLMHQIPLYVDMNSTSDLYVCKKCMIGDLNKNMSRIIEIARQIHIMRREYKNFQKKYKDQCTILEKDMMLLLKEEGLK